MRKISTALMLLPLCCAVLPAAAISAEMVVVQQADRAAVIKRLADELQRLYVFPDKARKGAAALKRRSPELLAIGNPDAFAKALTETLKAAMQDVHLVVLHQPEQPRSTVQTPTTSEIDEAKERNYGFVRVEVLDGNIGYIDLRRMEDMSAASAAHATAAMAMVADTDALIIDLRRNPGGSGQMNQLLSSYFFAEGSDPVWLATNEDRSAGTSRQEWTQVHVPGARMPHTPLYFLVGPGTGSAAEGFAYNLQAHKRAVVVGSNTAGGAHSGDLVPLGSGMVAFIPSGRVINPVTHTNWEGGGVTPDVRVDEDLADKKALELIWTSREKAAAEDERFLGRARWQLEYLHARLAPPEITQADMAAFVGRYDGERQVISIGKDLYYQRTGGILYRLLPLAPNRFAMEGANAYGAGANRIEFVRDAAEGVTGMRQLIRFAPLQVHTIDIKRLPAKTS